MEHNATAIVMLLLQVEYASLPQGGPSPLLMEGVDQFGQNLP